MATVTKQEYQNVQNAVNSAYTADSLNNYRSAYSNYMSQGMSSTDAANKASSLLVKSNVGTTTSGSSNKGYVSSSSNNTMSNTSKATNTSNTNKTSPYENQGAGNEKQGGNNQTSTPANSSISNAQNYWDSLTYEQQQEKINQKPGLKDAINKKGWTIKTADGQTVQQTTPQQSNVSNDGWDYQDNSPERMMQMANNLENMYRTDPGLFANEQTFKNFFINGKGRTPEQEQFLLDYYKNRQIYNEYDGYTSAKVGSMAANGQVPESYLNYLKNSNPQRYQEVMAGKEQEENRIKDNSSYSDLLNQAGFEDTANTAWQKKEGLLVDENNDLIDDRLYHEPTAEEREKVDRINEIDSEVLDIENTYKHTYDDLVEKYPGATKATLMAMAQDRCSDLLRRKEDLMVERTKLAGTVEYLQSERQAQDDAGKQTIANLQKNLGMYYDHSPEGMSQLAQAKYAATNVTLDQADNGTDTQKQMALQSVLDDYYGKYGSIIQRSESQVINDVMAYAKKNGVSLSQALEENFLKYLRQKPGFKQLNSVTSNPDVFKIGDDIYGYWDENGNLVPIGGSLGGGTNSTGELFGFTNYTPLTSQQLTSGIENFMAKHPVNSDGGQCGSFVNDYLQSLGYDRLYDDPIDKKKAVTNSDTAVKGAIAVMDSKNYPQYGHTAIVTDVKGDKVHLLESNWGDDEKVHERWVNKSEILGYFDPSKSAMSTKDVLNSKFTGDPDWNQNGYFNSLVPYFNTLIKDGKIDLTDSKYKEALKDYGIDSQQFNQMAANYANSELKGNGGAQASRALEMAIKTYEYLYGPDSQEIGLRPNGSTWASRQAGGYMPRTDVGKAKTEFDSMLNRLTLKELFDAKALGATFGAMSKDEWDVLRNAATDVKRGAGNFKENMEDLIESLYTATLDGNAQLPSNWNNSKAQQMVNSRITNGTALGNYSDTQKVQSSNGKFNAPTYVSTQYQSTPNGSIDYDAVFASLG